MSMNDLKMSSQTQLWTSSREIRSESQASIKFFGTNWQRVGCRQLFAPYGRPILAENNYDKSSEWIIKLKSRLWIEVLDQRPGAFA